MGMFIRVQNAKKDGEGNIIGGSASLVKSTYTNTGSSPTKQTLVERLGTIVFMPDRRSGISLHRKGGWSNTIWIPTSSPMFHPTIPAWKAGDCFQNHGYILFSGIAIRYSRS